jgi:hypothetical protein
MELLSFAVRSKVVVGRSKYEPGRYVKCPLRIAKNAPGLTVAQLVLWALIHLAGEASS